MNRYESEAKDSRMKIKNALGIIEDHLEFCNNQYDKMKDDKNADLALKVLKLQTQFADKIKESLS